jgi:hypothetical protein
VSPARAGGREKVQAKTSPSTSAYLPRPKSANGWFTRAVKATGVQAISAGGNVLALQRMLGHTSAKVTLDTSPTCSMTTWTRSR